MAHDVLMPQLGMAQNTAVIVSWAKALGDPISAGDVLMEVETDKSTVEVEAAHDGFLVDLRAAPGAEVPVGDVVAVISTDASHIVETTPSAAEEPATVADTPAVEPTVQPLADVQSAHSSAPTDEILASPKAKREASRRQLNLIELVKDGVSQPIHFKDVVEFQPTAPMPAISGAPTLAPSGCFSIKVPRQPFAEFCDWLDRERPGEISTAAVWMAFATRAFLGGLGSEPVTEIQCDYYAPDLAHMPVSETGVDKSLLSAIKAVPGLPPGDLAIYDFSTSLLSGHLPNLDSQMVALVVSTTANKLKVKWHFERSKVDETEAMRMAHLLAQLLNHPLQILA